MTIIMVLQSGVEIGNISWILSLHELLMRISLLVNNSEILALLSLHILSLSLSQWSHTSTLLNRSKIPKLVVVVIQFLSETLCSQRSIISLKILDDI